MISNTKSYGALPEIEPMRTYDYEILCGASSNVSNSKYPKEFIIDKKRLGRLKDQGLISCCVGCVMSSITEVFNLIEQYGENISDEQWKEITDTLGVNVEFSEGWAYGALREDYYGEGMFTLNAIKNWNKKGIVPKKYFNLLEEMPDMHAAVKKFPELQEKAMPYKIKSYASLNYANTSKKDLAIKDALMKYGVGLVGVSNSYFGGSHCITVVGWNDKTDSYKIKNSWGKDWGDENGVGEIPKHHLDSVYLVLDEEFVLPFSDVKEEDWFKKDVQNMYFAGLIKGITNTEYAPLQEATRGEVATIIERIINLTFERIELSLKVANQKISINIEEIMQEIKNTSNYKMSFVDVQPDSWYFNSIKNMYEIGLIKGITDTEYQPEKNVTRAEIATLCVRTCDFIIDKLKIALKNCNKLTISQENKLIQLIHNELPQYKDVPETDENGSPIWYYNYINKAYQLGIMSGVDQNNFEPERNVNRAEIAAIVSRLAKYLDIKNNILVEIF